MRSRGALALFLAAALSGCYTYIPVRDRSLTPSAEVRVRPTPEFRAELRSILQTEPSSLEGAFVRSDETGLLLEVVTAGIEYGVRARPLTQQIVVPWAQILEVEEKRLDRERTTGLAVAVGVLVTGAILHIVRGKAGGTPAEGPSGGDEVLLPLPVRLP